jgi:protein involved in polysaccharide export with SLBB domain
MKNWLIALVAVFATILSSSTAQAQADRIRTGDVINLKIAGVPAGDQGSIGGPYTVSSTGTIRLLYLDSETVASGMSMSELAKNIENQYKRAEIYTNPRVTVSPTIDANAQGMRMVMVGGAVRGPGEVPWRPGMTILDAVMTKGGFNEFAKSNKVKLMRGARTTIHDLKDVSSKPGENVELQPNDRVIVPDGLW